MQFEPLPEKRQIPEFVKKQSMEEMALGFLRRQRADSLKHSEELAAVQKKADRLAEELALQVHKKRRTEGDSFVQSMRQLLKMEGISLITYVGEAVTAEMEDETEIVEWLPAGEDTTERVVDAIEPEIRWEGRLIHRAKLSCRMAAEAEETAPAEKAEDAPAKEPQQMPVEEVQEAPAEEPQQTPVEEVQEAPAEEPQQTTVEEAQNPPAEEPQQTPVEEVQNTSAEEKPAMPEAPAGFITRLSAWWKGFAASFSSPAEKTDPEDPSKPSVEGTAEEPTEPAVEATAGETVEPTAAEQPEIEEKET